MGKKKDKTDDVGSSTSSSSKKSKKHKHKKSSKKSNVEKIVNVEEMEDVYILVDDFDQSSNLDSDMKINLPPTSISVTPAKTTFAKAKCVDKQVKTSCKKVSGKKKEGKGEDDTDSEEERWLDAIQSGKLEEVDDELKRMKNPRLMTARQRAMLEKRTDGVEEGYPLIPAEPLVALPTGFKEKVITEEMLAKKAIKSEKRRVQAQEKREEDKKKTVDRLLKKQDPKLKYGRTKSAKKDIPVFTYTNNSEGFFISVPNGCEFDLTPQVKRELPDVICCGVEGCNQPKKYSCSKTGIPLCSLQCYKNNLTLKSVEMVS